MTWPGRWQFVDRWARGNFSSLHPGGPKARSLWERGIGSERFPASWLPGRYGCVVQRFSNMREIVAAGVVWRDCIFLQQIESHRTQSDSTIRRERD
jgi:hypothetical protein